MSPILGIVFLLCSCLTLVVSAETEMDAGLAGLSSEKCLRYDCCEASLPKYC